MIKREVEKVLVEKDFNYSINGKTTINIGLVPKRTNDFIGDEELKYKLNKTLNKEQIKKLKDDRALIVKVDAYEKSYRLLYVEELNLRFAKIPLTQILGE